MIKSVAGESLQMTLVPKFISPLSENTPVADRTTSGSSGSTTGGKISGLSGSTGGIISGVSGSTTGGGGIGSLESLPPLHPIKRADDIANTINFLFTTIHVQ